MKKSKKLLPILTSLVLAGTMGLTACSPSTPKTPTPNGPTNEVGTLTEGTATTPNITTGFSEEKGKFYADYNTLDDAHIAGKDLNIRIAEEGMVLMKNANNALPLTRDERNVTLLGIKSVDIQTGGGGSGNGYTGSSHKSPVIGPDYQPVKDENGNIVMQYDSKYRIDPTTLVGSMRDAGFRVNQKVLDLYANNIAAMSYEEYSASSGSSQTLTRELPMGYYSDMVTKTYRAYNDAAIITFSRSGAEGLDEIAHEDSHVLQLTAEEKALVKHAKANFKKVVVLINTGNVVEVGELAAEKTADNLGVDAILYVGHVGNDGAAAIGRILNGEVNPSGHLVDLWSMDITKDPSYTNFGDMSQNGEDYDNYLYNGTTKTKYHSVEYREDIYVGYRYYETVAADMNRAEKGSGDKWYEQNVVYPFGHGLSYTTFKWELVGAGKGKIEAANSTITMQVKVTNTGDVTGKDVVQVYATQPYTSGGIEKAERVLVTYGKTELLKPGHSQVLTLQFTAQDMASFDWQDKNDNGFVGYELEKGDYIISAARDSHTPVFSVTRNIAETIKCATDIDTGKTINAVFSQTDGVYADYTTVNQSLLNNLITREGGLSQPKAATKADRTVNQAWVDKVEANLTYSPVTDDPKYAQFNVTSVPSGWTQAASHADDYSDVKIKIGDMSGVDYKLNKIENGTVVQGTDEGSEKWEQFMNQLTWEELCRIASLGSYGRPSVASINLPFQMDIDGPCQIAWYGNQQAKNYYGAESEEEAAMIAETADGMGTFWAGAVLIASTWNQELAEKQGIMVGNESMLTNSPGWYGPGCNMHRSALGGRNFEYYSEDPTLAGTICGAVVRGATSKGAISYIKHMFLNEQETDRGGDKLFTYVTEQAIREIYLKPFEYILKEGRSLGVMGAGLNIGDINLYKCDALLNGILRNEWDFKGMIITDSVAGRNHPDMDEMLRAGLDCPLGSGIPTKAEPDAKPNDLEVGEWDATAKTVKINGTASPTQWYTVRNAALHVLYATANSNGIDNGVNASDRTVEFDGGMVNTFILAPAEINAVAFSDVGVVSSTLPSTVSINTLGVISGRFEAPGTYTVTLSMLVDGWIPKTITLNVVVKDVVSVEGTITAGGAINTKLTNTAYVTGETQIKDNLMTTVNMPPQYGGTVTMPMDVDAKCTAVKYSSENLPDGLTLAEDGTLGGTLAAGTYTFTVTVTAEADFMYFSWFPAHTSVTFTQNITITVA